MSLQQRLGVVSRVCRFPVKSMAGEELERVFVTYGGLTGDRVYALVSAPERPGFPWLTARQRPRLLLYRPRFCTPLPDVRYPHANAYELSLVFQDGRTRVSSDPAFLEQVRRELECEAELRFSERGMHDVEPVSLIGEPTVETLARETGLDIDARRFRANFYVRWDQPTAGFAEDAYVGRRVQIGESLTLLVCARDPRCRILTLDPDTGEASPIVLETVTRAHEGRAGVYCVVLREGYAALGDPIRLV